MVYRCVADFGGMDGLVNFRIQFFVTTLTEGRPLLPELVWVRRAVRIMALPAILGYRGVRVFTGEAFVPVVAGEAEFTLGRRGNEQALVGAGMRIMAGGAVPGRNRPMPVFLVEI